jgi:hypothetical protein
MVSVILQSFVSPYACPTRNRTDHRSILYDLFERIPHLWEISLRSGGSAAYAETRGVQLLVENGGWLGSDPDAIPRMVKLIGRNVAPGPDTGNWQDEVRWEGLKNAFPGAVTCDFKVYELNEKREHTRYDIRRCFEIGWNAGFRGPWALER